MSIEACTRRALAALAAFVALVAATPRLHADGGERERIAAYRAAVTRAGERFAERDYAAARRQFEIAYELHAEPIVLFDIASTFRREGDDELAIQHYQRYLEEAAPDDAHRALALETIAELGDRIAARQAAAVARRRAERKARQARARARGDEDRSAELREPAEQPATDATPAPRGRALEWTGAAAGVAALGAFGMAWLQVRDARAAEDELENLPPSQGWDRAQADLYQEGNAASRRAWMWAAAGGALATTGVILLVIGHHQAAAAPDDASFAVAPAPGGGASVVMAAHF